MCIRDRNLEKNRVKALECELNTAKPKADYYDAFINPDDCTNKMCIRDRFLSLICMKVFQEILMSIILKIE